ncbi:MAG: TIR domain-containing protein [Betaproteobacteria bacterium]|nr:TIR domain-containing protein [Betaproteobacteria bacterium]
MTRAIFLSYASQDADAARRICESLRAAGLEVWFDQSELRGGDAWDQSIRKQIKECALFVPIITPNTQAREEGYFRLEWKLAVDRSHLMADNKAFFVPVLIGNVSEPAALVPDKFRERQWSRLNDDAAIAAFAERISKLLARSGSQGKNAPEGTPPPGFGSTSDLRRPFAGGNPAAFASDKEAALDSRAVTKLSGNDEVGSRGAYSVATQPAKDTTPSIAVLAFANRSASTDDEYFSDGLADELLNVLAKIKELRVAARTSAFSFKGRNDDIATIGQKLNVATVLEGSVRKSGNRVRVAVQLVKVADGYHQWSETYDRTLDDIFAVQDDIAQAVVKELLTTLMGEMPAAARSESIATEVARATQDRSDNSGAQRLFVQGRYFLARKSEVDIKRSVEYLKEAVALDPRFALAWALLAQAHNDASGWGVSPLRESGEAALAAAKQALTLDPGLAQSQLSMAYIQMGYLWDWAGAEASVQRALQIAPNDAEALTTATKLAFCRRKLDEAEAYGQRAIALDPLNAHGHRLLAMALFSAGKLEDAVKRLRQSLEVSPDSIATRHVLAMVLSAQGRHQEALAEAMQEKAEWARLTALSLVKWEMGTPGDLKESDEALAELIAKHAGHSAAQISHLHAGRGDADGTFEWLECAYEQRDAGLSYIIAAPFFDPIKHDPRWPVFVKKMGFEA